MAEVPNDAREVVGSSFAVSGERLGMATYGQVRLGHHLATGEKVAIKLVHKRKLRDSEDRARVTRGVGTMQRLEHPHVCQVVSIVETVEKVYVVLELAQGGNLLEHLRRNGRLPERRVQTLLQQLVSALDYCHRSGVVHRDLKLENVLLDEDGSVKLTSFGHCNEFDRERLLVTIRESPHFVSPEVVAGTDPSTFDTRTVDVWSLGVILYACLCGRLPFVHTQLKPLCKLILTEELSLPGFLSPEAADLLDGMLQKGADTRLTLDEVMRHTFLQSARQQEPASPQRQQQEQRAPASALARPAHLSNQDDEAAVAKAVELDMLQLGYSMRAIAKARHKPHLSGGATTYFLLRQGQRRERDSLQVVPSLPAEATRPRPSRAHRHEDGVVPDICHANEPAPACSPAALAAAAASQVPPPPYEAAVASGLLSTSMRVSADCRKRRAEEDELDDVARELGEPLVASGGDRRRVSETPVPDEEAPVDFGSASPPRAVVTPATGSLYRPNKRCRMSWPDSRQDNAAATNSKPASPAASPTATPTPAPSEPAASPAPHHP